MNAITYFKFKSPYDGDITKNCALTGSEVDNNFYTLEGRDIQSVELDDGKIVITLLNGEKLSSDNITEGCLKDLSIDFDDVNGILKITKNGVTQEIEGFVTRHNEYEAVATDGSLVGSGLVNSPVGISPVAKTGQYRPVKRIIDMTNGEKLPSYDKALPGDRYLTIENVNEYGYLYNYEGVKKIACKLAERHSQWRVPTKDDWDDMLNAIEPNDKFKNHDDARSNKFLGKFAGKLLKTSTCWKEEDTEDCGECADNEEEMCNCGREVTCHPNYCGEYGTCHHKHRRNNSGIDKYCFSVVPAGYANEAKDFLYYKERAYFWTATNHDFRDAYIKAFAYNKSSVLQDIIASDNYLSIRLVKDYTGDNFNERENILDGSYSTVLMPSVKNGQAIWTSVNIGLTDCGCDCSCKYVLPNNGEEMEFVKKYFTNEWNGKEWIKKELCDGESVVVINFKKESGEGNGQGNSSVEPLPDDNQHCGCHTPESEDDAEYEAKYIEYRVVNGELVNVAESIYNEVMSIIQEKIDGFDGSFEELNTKIENEITRSTEKDQELDGKIETEKQERQEKNAELEAKDAELVAKDAELEAKDAELVAKDAELEAKDAELEGKITTLEGLIEDMGGGVGSLEGKLLTQEGTVFDPESGILTLKSRDGSNDVQVQIQFTINHNFGTF